MRMSHHSKCNPNLVVGAILIFSIIVLYNYWNVSTLNRDLIAALNLSSKANEGLASNLEKAKDDKNKLQLQLQQEEMQGRDGRDRIHLKERLLKEVQNELETAKQEAQTCRDESAAQETKNQNREKELKEKITTLEAQVFEKASINDKLEGELSDAKQKIEDLQKLVNKPTSAASKSTAAETGAKPVPQPAEVIQQQPEPVLFNDPAVPFPKDWMNPNFSKMRNKPKVNIQDIKVGLNGILPHNSPVIIFDDPRTPVKKARFSVLDPPRSPVNDRYSLHQVNNEAESQMNPNVNKDLKAPDSLKEDNDVDAKQQGEREVVPGNDGVGVLALPDQPDEKKEKSELEKTENQQVPQPPAQQQQHGANLDAQEDDKDRALRDDAALQDDQSPDGSLGIPPKDKENEVVRDKDKESEPLAVVPAPPSNVIKQQQDLTGPLPIHHSGQVQDVREAAHLSNNVL